MLHLVHAQKRPQMSDKPDTAVDEYALLRRITEGDTLAFEAFLQGLLFKVVPLYPAHDVSA